MSQLVTLDIDADGVALVKLNDEAQKNALSEEFVAQLLERLHSVATERRIKAAVLAGLPEVFCAGATRELLANLVNGGLAPSDILLSKAVLDLPIPTVAAMEGHAIGGGLAIGLCADLVLISRESRYGASFMNMGFTPGMGITSLLEHVMTPAVAHEILFTGEAFKGRHFEGRSGFNYILPRAEVLPKALDLAHRIAEKPRVALETLKRTLSLPKRMAFERTRTVETLMHQVSFAQSDIGKIIMENYD